ncbi:MAG: hypothetical protein AVDCRST_MAG50-2376, partial [uncultured Acidimicrobiales bacterium]
WLQRSVPRSRTARGAGSQPAAAAGICLPRSPTSQRESAAGR